MNFIKKVINAYKNFISYLKSKDTIIDHTYLWDMVCFADKELIKSGLNLIIIENFKNNDIENVKIVCPTNHYSNTFFDKRKNTVIFIKTNNNYEPIYLYEEKIQKQNIENSIFDFSSPNY